MQIKNGEYIKTMKNYEISQSESNLITKNKLINTLLGYPNTKTKTERYRKIIKHKDQDLWAGVVEESLVRACESMTPEERFLYYNEAKFQTYQYLKDNDWFPEH